MNKVVITGASGHLGFNIANELLNKGYHITCLIRKENINILKLKAKGAIIHSCNLFDASTYNHQLEGIKAAFHIAAENTTSKANPERVIANSFLLTKTFIDACCEKQVPTIIYTSSVVVLGRSKNPKVLLDENAKTSFVESPYVEGKIAADKYIDEQLSKKELDIRRLYPAWIVGPGDPRLTPPHKIITDFVETGQFFYFKGGISLCEVGQVAKAHIAAFEKGKKNEKYVLGGDNITFKTFYTHLSTYCRHSKPFIFIPKPLIVAAVVFAKWLFRAFGMQPLIEPAYAKSVFGNYSWYTSEKAVKELNYSVVSARKIISNAVEEANKRIVSCIDLGFKRVETVAEPSNEGVLLITGVPGWLGNRMVDIFINGDRIGNFQNCRKIRLLVEHRYAGFFNLPENYEIVYGNLSDKKSLLDATKNVKSVFHLAGLIYPSKIKLLYKVNTEGTKNLVDACIENNVRRIVYMATDSICGHGTSEKRIFDEYNHDTPYKHYGKSKYLAEKYILDKTREGLIDGTSLRGFWFFGPFAPQRQLSFFKMFYLPRQLVFGRGTNFRTISHVDNIVQAFIKAENNPKTYGKWYWIGGDNSHLTVNEMFETICRNLGVEYKPFYIPKSLCKLFETGDSILAKAGYLVSSIHAAGKFYYDIAGTSDAAKCDFDYQVLVSDEEAFKELSELLNN